MNIEELNKITNINVLVFGDYMVDKYIIGNVSRISPEAPIPVIEVINKNEKLGGAGNVINNIIKLGGKVRVLSCLGNDDAGNFIKNCFARNNVDIKYLRQYDDVSTIVKTRIVSKNQQFVRIDEENKEPLLNNYYEFIKHNINDILRDVNVIVISDYGKGSVTKEAAQLLIKHARKNGLPVIIDPKGTDYSKYKGATICTPNVKELSDYVNKSINTEEEIKKYGKKLCSDIELETLVLTRSEKGISTINKSGKKNDYPAVVKEVIDVSGAGDTVVATISLLKSLNFELADICKLANIAAGIVVSKFGTATVSLDELIDSINNKVETKIKDIDSLKVIVENLKLKGKKIVFTNGCFDMLHVGHLQSFTEAKKYGDVLIVAVNSDASVKENKGDLRPIISQNDRINMINALEVVDYVILMEDKTPINLIKKLQPDISIKGEDWKDKYVPEKEIIEEYGGQIKFIKLNPNNSTTLIIEKVLKAYEK